MNTGFSFKFCYGGKDKNGVNPLLFLEFIQIELESFIEIFNFYLSLVIGKLDSKKQLIIEDDSWKKPNMIYSFNYTNTYQKIHNMIEVEYLHGSYGELQNIVLGISDLEEECLKRLKAYGFTKYHQKLLKNTNYLFLKENSTLMNRIESKSIGETIVNIIIWGHSLAKSDESYIQEIFSFNQKPNVKIIVTVYFFNLQAKFDLLANLLNILGKEKIENWMKKGWLKFEKTPNIAEINGIKPVALPKN